MDKRVWNLEVCAGQKWLTYFLSSKGKGSLVLYIILKSNSWTRIVASLSFDRFKARSLNFARKRTPSFACKNFVRNQKTPPFETQPLMVFVIFYNYSYKCQQINRLQKTNSSLMIMKVNFRKRLTSRHTKTMTTRHFIANLLQQRWLVKEQKRT